MSVSQFPCPHCSTSLRIKDRMFVGKIVGCPDCGNQLEIVSDGPRKLTARKLNGATEGQPASSRAMRDKPAKHPAEQNGRPQKSAGIAVSSSRPAAKRQSERAARKNRTKGTTERRLVDVLKNPVVVAWVLALAATGTIVGLVLSRVAAREDRRPGPAVSDADDSTHHKSVVAGNGAKSSRGASDPWHVDGADARRRLRQIGLLLSSYAERHGAFPPAVVAAEGLPVERRLSWQARLAAASPTYGHRQPQWDRPWNDPVNEAFARQRIPLFRNPSLPDAAGADGLPVAHFAGVAGVGKDGPYLPANHPRAGVFGYNRATRRRDIRDGLEHTMMVAGVRQRVGGWAHGGSPTMRAFTTEPYVNGPDGFGTGQKDRMLVLMADGRVREVSRNTSPVIVRRMAAMADGLPLDPRVPGDPQNAPPPEHPPAKADGKTNKGAKPVRMPKPPAVAVKPVAGLRAIDVQSALAQRILAYEQSGRAPLRELLAEVQEMAGVPIHVDPALAKEKLAPLDRRVARIQLNDVTVGDILRELFKGTGLSYAVEKDGVRVFRAR